MLLWVFDKLRNTRLQGAVKCSYSRTFQRQIVRPCSLHTWHSAGYTSGRGSNTESLGVVWMECSWLLQSTYEETMCRVVDSSKIGAAYRDRSGSPTFNSAIAMYWGPEAGMYLKQKAPSLKVLSNKLGSPVISMTPMSIALNECSKATD